MSDWIEKKENWLPGGKRLSRKKIEPVYSIAEIARIAKVDKRTVMKWLTVDENNESIIKMDEWFKLPGNAGIRVKKSAVERILHE